MLNEQAKEVLETAIADVGQWNWWQEDLPQSVSVEFYGVQLWEAPRGEDRPPPGMVALRLKNPVHVEFLRRGGSLSDDWPSLMRNDELDAFSVSHDEFVLRSPQALQQIVDEASDGQVLVDSAQSVEELASSHEFVGFWAGPVGFVGFAEDIEAIIFAGVVSSDEIEQRHRQWWEYWKEYWQRRESADPMPRDYACEVTIPLGTD